MHCIIIGQESWYVIQPGLKTPKSQPSLCLLNGSGFKSKDELPVLTWYHFGLILFSCNRLVRLICFCPFLRTTKSIYFFLILLTSLMQQPVSSAKGKPSKLQKRKHQIGSLYFDMKQKEMELSERRARGFLTKAETQAKYGWWSNMKTLAFYTLLARRETVISCVIFRLSIFFFLLC